MTTCADVRGHAAFYLDDELRDDERRAFELHVAGCAPCSREVDAERDVIALVRSEWHADAAPETLRKDVVRILDGAPAAHRAPSALRTRIARLVGRPSQGTVVRRSLAIAAAASLAFMSVFVAWNAGEPGGVEESEFATMAVATHQRHLRGGLPLEIRTESAESLKLWFADKVPFLLELPTYQEVSGQERLYGIVGARLVGYRGDYAAFIAYEMAARPISLIVTSASLALPSGGQTVVSKGLTFHFDVVDGQKVITWSHRGLTYALVSDLEERGEASCKVCHAGTQDQDFLEGIRADRLTEFQD